LAGAVAGLVLVVVVEVVLDGAGAGLLRFHTMLSSMSVPPMIPRGTRTKVRGNIAKTMAIAPSTNHIGLILAISLTNSIGHAMVFPWIKTNTWERCN